MTAWEVDHLFDPRDDALAYVTYDAEPIVICDRCDRVIYDCSCCEFCGLACCACHNFTQAEVRAEAARQGFGPARTRPRR